MLLVVARGLFVACLISGFGSALFAMTLLASILPSLDTRTGEALKERVRSLLLASLGGALAISVAWLVLESETMSGASTLGETAAAIPDVFFSTTFGNVLALQDLAVAGALAATAIRRGPSPPVLLAGLAALLEAGHSHAYAMGHGALLLSQALHLLAAGAWLGALMPLLIVVRAAPLAAAALAARRFAMNGTVSVAVLAGTAFYQGLVLSGGLRGLTGTAYGGVLMIKAALFALLLALAALNRWRLTPALARGEGEAARRGLVASITTETVIGLSVVLAASALSSLEPGMHMPH